MPNREAIDGGFEFEKMLAKLIDGDLHPGSGNKWYAKLDVGSGSIIFSAKATKEKTFRITPAMFQEVDEEIHGPGGRGGGAIGAHAVQLEMDPEQVYVAFRIEDLLRLLREEITLGREKRSEAITRQAAVPELLREDDENA